MKVHVLPREMLGTSTFGLSMLLLKWLPIQLVDSFLLVVSRFILGDTTLLGLNRPRIGPLELKNLTGKTPVLDVGTLAKIKTGDIKVQIYLNQTWYMGHISLDYICEVILSRVLSTVNFTKQIWHDYWNWLLKLMTCLIA